MTARTRIAAALCELAAKTFCGEWLNNGTETYIFSSFAGCAADIIVWSNGQMRLPGVVDDYFLWGDDPAQPADPHRGLWGDPCADGRHH